jgi:hypothetical protein
MGLVSVCTSASKTFALAIVVILLVICLWSHLGDARRSMGGFWDGESDFLADSDLTHMYLQIEPGSLKGLAAPMGRAEYEAWLVMSTEDGLICNQGLTIALNLGHSFQRKDSYKGTATLTFDDPETAPWPSEVEVVVSPCAGTLAIHNNEDLLAFCCRNHII